MKEIRDIYVSEGSHHQIAAKPAPILHLPVSMNKELYFKPNTFFPKVSASCISTNSIILFHFEKTDKFSAWHPAITKNLNY